VREVAEACQKGLPVANAVAFDAHELDVSGVAKEALLEVAPHAVGDGEGYDERGNACCDSCDGDERDEANDGLATLGAEITQGDEELKTHGCLFCLGREDYFGPSHVVVAVVDADGDEVFGVGSDA